MKSFTKKALGLCVMSAIAAGNSYAALEEIVVTASKREQAVTDVPFSISAIGGDELENKGIVDLQGLSREIPSASFSQSFSSTASVMAIRGITAHSGSDPTTGYYIDDFAFSFPGFSFGPPANLYDLERVEVLRGPQGTLYGASAMGGLVRMITADPDASAGFGGKAQVSYSDYTDGDSSLSGDIALNIPLIEDVLAARVVASYKDGGGYIDRLENLGGVAGDLTESDANDVQLENYRVKLKYTPNDELIAKLSVWHTEDDDNFGTLIDLPSEDRSAFQNFANFTAEQTITNFALSYEFESFTLEHALTYADYEQTQVFGLGPIPAASFPGGDSHAVFESEVLTEELRLVSNGDGPWKWMGGVFYRKADQVFDLAFDVDFTFDSTDVSTVEAEEIAVFGEVSYAFLDDALEVLVGFRYSEEERDFTSDLLQRDLCCAGLLDRDLETSPSNTYETFNPRFNVTWRPNDDTQVYLNIAKGYRPGKANIAANVGPAALAGFPEVEIVKDDLIWSYELGTKATLLDGDLLVEAAVYYNDWQDALFTVLVPFTNGTFINVGDMEILGFDLNLVYATPIEGLTATLSGNISHGEWDKVDSRIPPIDGNIAEGRALAFIPDHTALFKLDYVAPVTDSLNLLASASYYYRDQQADIATGIVAGAQQLVNVQVGIESPDDWSATLFVNNANDEDEVNAFTSGLPTVGAPREIGLRVQKHF